MRELQIKGVPSRAGKRRTTIPDPKQPPATDIVGRRFVAARPNALWLADITYVPTLEGWLFLAVVVDMYSRKIVGWSMLDDLKDLVVDALAMAVTRRRPPVGLVHHSDSQNMGGFERAAWPTLRSALCADAFPRNCRPPSAPGVRAPGVA